MENPFLSNEEVMEYWEPSGTQAETLTSTFEGGMTSLSPEEEDVLQSVSELMGIDSYAGWGNNCATMDSVFMPCGFPSIPPMSTCGSMEGLAFPGGGSYEATFPLNELGGAPIPLADHFTCGDNVMFQQPDTEFGVSDANEVGSESNDVFLDMENYLIPRSFGWSLDERMLRALSLFKESSPDGILAQVWVPMKYGNQFFLTTSEQPYLLDKMLTGYREVSRLFKFPAEGKPGALLGLPGRVFTSKTPEWTSNIRYYKEDEYLRMEHAIDHEVYGSMALPVFNNELERSCCAVLEVVTKREKPDFDAEIALVTRALENVNLRTVAPPRLYHQCLKQNQRSALAEIMNVLRAVCHAHRLPLALTWIPCYYTSETADEAARVRVKENNITPKERSVLCIDETACYVNDKTTQGFVHACMEHHLEEGQGIAGKALLSNHPFFYPDVKAYDINKYPLVHHARKFDLNAAVAIKLRSTYTGDDDYILEFFLPTNVKGSSEQQLLLNNLSGTMQRMCRSLRTVSNEELMGVEDLDAGFQNELIGKFATMSRRKSQSTVTDNKKKKVIGSRRRRQKKRTKADRKVTFNILQQHFSGSLKDASKSIGVCPTTLKRICRQHGILRWPSRKINKVNRSIRRIQTVLDSVQGVEGGLKFDPTTGSLTAVGPLIPELNGQNSLPLSDNNSSIRNLEPFLQDVNSIPHIPFDSQSSAMKFEMEDSFLATSQRMSSMNVLNPEKELNVYQLDCSGGSKSIGVDAAPCQLANLDVMGWDVTENAEGYIIAKKRNILDLDSNDLRLGDVDYEYMAKTLGSFAAADEAGIVLQGDDIINEHYQLTTSSMVDSSNNSDLLIHGSSSSCQSVEQRKHLPEKICSVDSDFKIVVKASYKEDTIRFKFDPSLGYLKLYEEVGKRFKLNWGAFQLKYLDDEQEWVMLVSNSDLQECLEVMDEIGTKNVKFLVRDIMFAVGSTVSSSCFRGP